MKLNKNIISSMIAMCSLHVLQGVYDDTEGSELFSQKRKMLVKNLLKEVDEYFVKILTVKNGDDEGAQLQFNNLANIIEEMAKWMAESESEDILAERIGKLAVLMGHEVEFID